MDILLVVSGLIGGVLGGMGLGGGTLLIPLLITINNLGQHTAQTLNLISFIPMSVVAIIIHIKNKNVEYKDIVFFVIFGIVASFSASKIANLIDGKLLKKFFGIFLLILAVYQIFLMVKPQKEGKKAKKQEKSTKTKDK